MDMTPDRLRILSYLSRQYATEIPPTAKEVAIDLGERARASDWAHGKLRSLHWQGMVETVGISAFGTGRTWRITDAGRAALAQGTETRRAETPSAPSRSDDGPAGSADAP